MPFAAEATRHLERGRDPVRRDEAQLAGRARVPAAGDEDGAEPVERRAAGVPVGEGQPRVAGAADAVGLDRPRDRPPPLAPPRRASPSRGPSRVAWKNARYGCCVGWANRRRKGVTRIAVPPSRTGKASRQSRSA